MNPKQYDLLSATRGLRLYGKPGAFKLMQVVGLMDGLSAIVCLCGHAVQLNGYTLREKDEKALQEHCSYNVSLSHAISILSLWHRCTHPLHEGSSEAELLHWTQQFLHSLPNP